MDTIIPCRSSITDRFPIASFVIRTPRERYFEVACATDPRLFHTDYAGQRAPNNFYSSRQQGVLRNDRGDTTWMVPAQALRRFAGGSRLYYALATYGGRGGEDARFSIAPSALDRVPSIAIGSDFTGRSLDRRRIGGEPVVAAYGGRSGEPLRWGGDAVLEAERTAGRRNTVATTSGYDDGYDAGLWGGQGDGDGDGDEYDEDEAVPTGLAADGEPDDDEVEDGAESYGMAGARRTRGCGCGAPYRGPSRGAVRAQPRFGLAAGQCDDAEVGVDEYEDGAEFHLRNPDRAEPPAAIPSSSPPAAQGLHASGYGDWEDDGETYGRHGGRGRGSTVPARARAARAGAAAPLYGRRIECPTLRRHSGYREDDVEESLPVGPAALPLGVRALEAVALDIPEKVRLLRIVARADGGADGYAAIAIEDDGEGPAGISWGLLLFSQCGGALGRVLRRAWAREQPQDGAPAPAVQTTLTAVFGEALPALLRTTDPELTADPEARLAAVDGHVLWEEPWLSRFRAAGALAQVQAAQHEEAIVEIFDRMLPIARALGLATPRQLAIIVDRAVHMGVGGARSWIMRVAGPIRTQADRATALAALGARDLAELQRAHGLVPDGLWSAATHAALAEALRALPASPLPLLTPDAVLAALLAAARDTDFADRIRALADNTTDFDDTVTYAPS